MEGDAVLDQLKESPHFARCHAAVDAATALYRVSVTFVGRNLFRFSGFQANGLGALSPGQVGFATPPWVSAKTKRSLKDCEPTV